MIVIRYLWIYFLCIRSAEGAWPLSNLTDIKLLGLFDTLGSPITSRQCRAMFQSAVVLSQRLNVKINNQLISWYSKQTDGNAMNALSITCRLVTNSTIVGIVGPELSRESHLIARFTSEIGIPVISYGSTDPDLSDRNIYRTFFRTISSDNTIAKSIVDLFIRFNWTSCIIIYQNDEFGNGGVRAISETFHSYQLNVSQTILFDINTQKTRSKLKYILTNNPTRIVVVWAMTKYTTQIIKQALENNLLSKEQFIWILSSPIQLNHFDEKSYEKFNGMLIIEPIIGNIIDEPRNETLLNSAIEIWKEYELETFPGLDQINTYALFAFDATWTLIESLKHFSSISFTNQTFCFDRQLIDSSSYLNSIINHQFLGVSGYIQFDRNQTDRMNGTYYILNNLQYTSNSLNTVPVLIWSESTKGWISHRQKNVIVWPGNYLHIPSDYASLQGLTIRIAVKISEPFTMLTQNTDELGRNIIGYIPDLIKKFEKKMNFKSNITVLSSNSSYNSLIDAVVNDVYDLVIADITITAERMEKVSFSSSLFDNSLRLIMHESPMIQIDFSSFLRPFSFQLWLALLCASIYSGFLICLLEREHNESLRTKSFSSLLLMSFWYSIGTILGYGADFQVQTAAGRLLTVGLYLLSLISVAAYTANLASDLTVAKTNGIISGIDDIRKGKIAHERIGILVNTSIEQFYLREISESKKDYYPLKTRSELYKSFLNNQIDVAIIDSGAGEYIVNNRSHNLILVGNDFHKNAFGIVFRKNSFYEQYFDIALLSLRENGELDRLKEAWFQTNTCTQPAMIFTSMTIESLAGLFLIFGIISLLSIVLFLWKHRHKIKDFIQKKLRSDE